MPDLPTTAVMRPAQAGGALQDRKPRSQRMALHALQCRVLEAVASGRKLARVADILCREIEALLPATVCSVLSVDEAGRLHPLGGPSLPEAFSRAIDGLPIGPQAGSCGAAAFGGRPVGTADIDSDPGWQPYKAIPLAAGLRACWSTPIKGRDGRVVGTFAFYYRTARASTPLERDVVETSIHLCALAIEHEEVWNRLALTNQRLDVALDNMSQGLCFFDGAERLILANRRYAEIYDLRPDSLRPGMLLEDILHLRVAAGSGPRMQPHEYLGWRATMKESTNPTDTLVELANGRIVAIHRQPMPDTGSVATHEDITARRRSEAQIAYMARHDALTSLANRTSFHETLQQAVAGLATGRRCAVLCFDLDHFKSVNDAYGHPAGDALLQRVAERTVGIVRATDTVCRLGGDEFAVLLPNLEQAEEAGELARRLICELSEPFRLECGSILVGASVGIAVAPRDGLSPGDLLKSADTALYRAKLEERGTFRFFEPEMDARLQARMALERDLRQAIQEQQFELAYQPMLDLATDQILGFEALLRWRHPQRGNVPPSEFIPVAEETGLICTLGAWALHQACMEAAHWPHRIKVAVNLSTVQFKQKTLVETVSQALLKARLPAKRLELEVTESLLLSDKASTQGALHALRALGISISIDDFGTGYSSLSYLRSFPFDKIKIDQSFIRDLSDAENSIGIVRAILGLGRSLGMTTIAEGVETLDQLERLRQEGCSEAQGFLLGRPVSAENVRLLLCPARRRPAARAKAAGRPLPQPAAPAV